MSAIALAPPPARSTRPQGRVRSVYRVERRKLSSQLVVRLLALLCLLAPFLFAALLRAQSGSPADALYGAWARSNGFATSLVVLGFAGTWGIPVIAGVIAGDIFSSEDRHGTWKLVLTRSVTREQVFTGKVLAAAALTLGLLALLSVSSLAAGALIIGLHPLVSLSGTTFSTTHVLGLVLACWASTALPALAFAATAILLSVATRNGIAGVVGPALLALVMQLLFLVGSGVWGHLVLIGAALQAWHGLFAGQVLVGQLLVGLAVSTAWIAACLLATRALLRRRDVAAAPDARRGWAPALRIAAALAAGTVALALAGNLGPSGVTAARLKGSLVPAFSRLTLLQQQELGRQIPAGAHLNVVLPSCTHRSSRAAGPGDWACTINVLLAPPGATVPPQPTPVTYDVSVQWNGCYKAESPPAFIGQPVIHDPDGNAIVNPLYTIYGCFNVL